MINPSLLRDPRIRRGKESSRRTPKPNSKLLILKFKTNSKKSLQARRRTKTKGIMERKKSSVHTAGREKVTLISSNILVINMPNIETQ